MVVSVFGFGMGATILEWQVDFNHGWPWWVVALVTGVVLASMVLFYRRAAGRVPRRYFLLLVALRCVAMAALLLCLFTPVIRYQRKRAVRPTLLLMADTSKSMSVHDFAGQPSRFESVRKLLTADKGVARALADDFDMRWYAFDSHARALKGRGEYAALKPDGEATDLSTSVKDALGKVKSSSVEGVILITDGVDTTILDPGRDLPELGVPIFTVGAGSILGQTENYRDIAIDHVDARRDAAVKTTLPVTVFVKATGFPNRVVPVILKEDEREVGREELVLDNDPGLQKVVLKYTPQNKGDFELTIEIPADTAERVSENNVSTVPVWVGDPRLRVLYVEGVIRQEYKYLRRVLQLDPQVEILSLLRTGANLFYQQGSIKDIRFTGFPSKYEELKQFRVLILGSLESEAFSKEQMGFIKQFVAEGGGLIVLGGDKPVEVGGMEQGQERAPFDLTLTDSGARHPVFAGITKFFAQVKGKKKGQVPRLRGCTVVLRAKPAADVLAVDPLRRNEYGPLVALAAGRYGSGRVLAATFDSTWLWYTPMQGLGLDSPYVRYWGQAIRWLAGVEETQRAEGSQVTAYADKRFYDPGERPLISARVTDKEGLVTERAVVSALIRPEGEEEAVQATLSAVSGRRGDYEGRLEALNPGKYEVTVSAKLAGQDLGEATIKFRVGEPTREFEKLDLNEALLRSIATASRGRYLPLLSFHKLPEIIRSRQEEKVERKEIFLSNNPALFLAFVLLITGEWILRKRRLLS